MTPALWLLWAAALASLAWQVRPVWVWLARAVVGRWCPLVTVFWVERR